MSTVKYTPSNTPHNLDTHQLGVYEWVVNLQTDTPQQPASEHHSMQRTALPVAHAEEVLACSDPWAKAPTMPAVPTVPVAPAAPAAPRRTTGEWVSWLD